MVKVTGQSTGNFPDEHKPKHEALAEIRFLSARITSLAEAVAEFDIALMQSIAIRSNESQAAFIQAGQKLSALLETAVA